MDLKNTNSENELSKLAKKYNTDKNPDKHNYTNWYYNYFSCIKNKSLKLLEIGVKNGNSHRMWQKFFSKGQIFGIDIKSSSKKHEDKRIKIFTGDQADKVFLKKTMDEIGKMDIIIDDGGHTMNQQKTSFEFLFPYLKSNSIYVIEDLHTSYYNDCLYIDSPYTMVSYIKYLLDCVNFKYAATRQNNENINLSGFEKYIVNNILSIHIYNSICFIFKK